MIYTKCIEQGHALLAPPQQGHLLLALLFFLILGLLMGGTHVSGREVERRCPNQVSAYWMSGGVLDEC